MAKHKVADYIPVDGPIVRLPATAAKLGLEKLQSLVGGYFEHALGRARTEVWCNENGLAEGLAYNARASQRSGLDIVGNAVIEAWE